MATRREKNLVQSKNKRTHLTPTGLLMEGDYTNYCLRDLAGSDKRDFESNRYGPIM